MKENQVILKKRERFFLEDKFYLISKGSVSAYELFENGKYLPKGGKFKEGDLIGNFFSIQKGNFILPEISVEIIALEDETILEEFKFDPEEVLANSSNFEKIIFQLLKENLFKLFYQLYDKKRYILSVLKFYANEKGEISKEYIRFENFTMSKSQFYSLYAELKREKYIIEKKSQIFLSLEKVESFILLDE